MTDNQGALEFLGRFPQDRTAPDKLDAILAYAFNKSDLETSRSLFASKWWDYRYIHPGHAFFLFAHTYAEAVERWRTMFGVKFDVSFKGLHEPIWAEVKEERKGTGVLSSRTFNVKVPALISVAKRTSMWRAMCIADSHGIPYRRFIDLAFEFAQEFNWSRMPRPQNLYSDQIVRWIVEHFQAEVKDLMHLPADPRFRPASYVGDPYQDQFQEHLLDLIAARPRPILPLTEYLAKDRYLVTAKAVERFGKPMVREAVERARST